MIRLRIDVPAGYTVVAGKSGMRSVLRKAGAEVAQRARALIRQKAAGGGLRSSVPGEPPVSRTGELARSIRVNPWKSGEGVTIRDAAFYALFLEAGARGGGNPGTRMPINPKTGKRKRARGVLTARVLEPHPFLSTALDQVANNGLGQRVTDALVDGIAFKRAGP